ncbi:MAG: transposase [Pseudomonadota bacterium]
MEMEHLPHQCNLRKGRFSDAGRAYFITKCTFHDVSLIGDQNLSESLINTLFWMDSKDRLGLGAFVIMPDHYHMVIILKNNQSLDQTMKSISSFSSKEINRLVVRSGQFWQRGYFDRAIRKSEDIRVVFDYVHNNPVRRRLVERAEDWRHSSLNQKYYRKIRWDLFMY